MTISKQVERRIKARMTGRAKFLKAIADIKPDYPDSKDRTLNGEYAYGAPHQIAQNWTFIGDINGHMFGFVHQSAEGGAVTSQLDTAAAEKVGAILPPVPDGVFLHADYLRAILAAEHVDTVYIGAQSRYEPVIIAGFEGFNKGFAPPVGAPSKPSIETVSIVMPMDVSRNSINDIGPNAVRNAMNEISAAHLARVEKMRATLDAIGHG
jgi:hypothetical protein